MKTLIIDNYDSFTFNLYQYVAEIIGEEPIVIRNNQLSINDIKEMVFDNIIISPGPGRPDIIEDFGVCQSVIEDINVPILGVCLGHQGIAYKFGGKINHAPEAMHGRISKIYHDGKYIFKNIPNGFKAVRYHSLIVDNDIPSYLEKIAWTQDGLVMGLAHKEKPIWGVQFHPESICTEYGKSILRNFCNLTEEYYKSNTKPSKLNVHTQSSNKISVIPKNDNVLKLKTNFKVCVKELEYFKDPEQVFLHFYGDDENAVWLDSSLIVDGFSRFSFMGGSGGEFFSKVSYNSSQKKVVVEKKGVKEEFNESIFDYLNRELNEYHIETPGIDFNFNCGFVGYFGYEIRRDCGYDVVYESDLPDAIFLFLDRVIAFDNKYKKMYLLNLVESDKEYKALQWFEMMEEELKNLALKSDIKELAVDSSVEFYLSRDYKTYTDDISKCLEYIKDGESYEICLTNKINANIDLDPMSYYRVVRRLNPAPYGTYLRFNDIYVAGSSPERFIYIDKDGVVESKPMKGTIKRGETKEKDEQLFCELERDEKSRAENLMICDLLRNDMGIVCEVGSIHVPQLMAVETYSTVHQMISLIRGKLRKGMNAIDCIRACFPGGSMTGTPKKRTMEIIEKLEKEPRGIYSGCIGYLALNNTADFNIVIRTAVITPGKFSVGVGGAIVALSDIQKEFDEIMLKGRALINSVEKLIPKSKRNGCIVRGAE